ncbi:hypothetical protein [Cohnella silvisoli]|uniref:Uncharacterized protein n=1 Tax=Cohnella silvisoli TaxID=2873699 RepID=A0ABV1KLB4_9BACL|nr:hypothetical protein [Cohnella silvisoli]MCD9020873.1 hypothetical protein [Cohnella silvisoli]
MSGRARSNAVSSSSAPFVGAQRSAGPARAPMMGAHRQQEPALEMQEAVGNQATQQAMDATPLSPEAYLYGGGGSEAASLGSAGPTPTPAAGLASVDAHSYLYGGGSSAGPELPTPADPAPATGGVYGAYRPPEDSSSAAPTAYSGIYNAYSAPERAVAPLAPSPPRLAAPANGGPSQATGPSSTPVPTGANASSAPAPSDNGNFAMKPMLAGMTSFDSSVQRPNPHMQTQLPSTTFYADTAEKRAQYARGFNDKGEMSSLSDGSNLNTIGAERPAAIGAKGDRHIFTMDGAGQFYTGDAIQENKTRGREAADRGALQQERFHHSSFLGGEEVAGAGEMQVRDGQVELVSDTSGHYRPGSKQMMQTVQQLEKNKVQTERLGVEFVGKNGTQNMQASATELLGYADHNPETAEDQMREKHSQKNSVLGELLSKSRNNPEGQNLKPSELNRRPEGAAPSAAVEQENEGASGFYMDEEDNEEPVYNDLEEIEDEEEQPVYSETSEEDAVQYSEIEHNEAENEEDTYYN